MQKQNIRVRTVSTLAALTFSGCALHPTIEKAPSVAGGFVTKGLAKVTDTTGVPSGEAQTFRMGTELPGEWWTLFGSSELDVLIEDAMANYPDVAAQQAALRAARENVRAEAGVFFPQLQGNFNQTREKVSGAAIAPGFPSFITNIFQANINVSYTFDLFGAERQALHGLEAQAEAQNFRLEASYVTLTSNVAMTAIQLASVQEQIAATHEILDAENKQLTFIRRQFELGSQTRANVLQQQSNLATVRSTLPALQQQEAVAEHQLAVLTGKSPDDAPQWNFKLFDLKLPQDLPVSLPSSLVAQRPDIRLQEAQLHQAAAAIGVATANLLPQLTITGSYGNESLRFARLFEPGANVWSIAAGVTQPIFAGGTLRAKRRAAIDAYQQATAQYRLTVLKAFENVADTLTALDNDAQELKAQYEAVTASTASLDLIQRQYDAGAVNFISLPTAQQAYQQSRIAYVRSVASRYMDTVTLFQALGGGWWNRADAGTLRSAQNTWVRHN